MLRDALKDILEVQEYDIKMIRLMRLKKERQTELMRIQLLRDDLHHKVIVKEGEIIELKKQIRLFESDISELTAKAKKLEGQQNSVKKVEEFNALTQEISAVEREKAAKEQRLSDLYDKLAAEEDLLKNLKSTYETTVESSQQLEKEIQDSVKAINEEGTSLKKERDKYLHRANPEILQVYEKLLKNKKDRVIVPIENRCCSGCHILVTAQHENLVRKGEKLVFCEHCSRIHYWQGDKEKQHTEEEAVPSRRRRRAASV
jgi:predicted  nucleic acid-binding Zn-ribbon protein